jgi:hypothetical protein
MPLFLTYCTLPQHTAETRETRPQNHTGLGPLAAGPRAELRSQPNSPRAPTYVVGVRNAGMLGGRAALRHYFH